MKITYKHVKLTDNIAEVIDKYPYLSETFLDYGLHCVGCFAQVFDTIEGGCMVHGMTKKEINSLMTDLNKFVELKSNAKEKK